MCYRKWQYHLMTIILIKCLIEIETKSVIAPTKKRPNNNNANKMIGSNNLFGPGRGYGYDIDQMDCDLKFKFYFCL